MRNYDNGTISANRSAQYLQAVQDRLRRHASLNVPPAKTLEELAGDFFEKTAEYRAAVELHRVTASTHKLWHHILVATSFTAAR